MERHAASSREDLEPRPPLHQRLEDEWSGSPRLEPISSRPSPFPCFSSLSCHVPAAWTRSITLSLTAPISKQLEKSACLIHLFTYNVNLVLGFLLQQYWFLCLAVSHSYGYGLLDAGAIVTLAKNWTNVGPQQKCVLSMLSEPRWVKPYCTY